jgi:hypothetical protein
MPLVTISFVTLMNCDLNMYSHIPYKPLQDCDYKQKKTLQNNSYARIKVPILFKFLTWVILSFIIHY